MSPLTRSLLAFLALIATGADAKITKLPPVPGGKCAGFRMDFTKRQHLPVTRTLTFQFKASGDGQLHNIPDHCTSEREGMMLSQTVNVCNEFDHPKFGKGNPPTVFAFGDEKPSPVFAACNPVAEANHECGLLTFYITQQCHLVIAY